MGLRFRLFRPPHPPTMLDVSPVSTFFFQGSPFFVFFLWGLILLFCPSSPNPWPLLQVVFFAWTIYLSTVVSKGGGGATEEAWDNLPKKNIVSLRQCYDAGPLFFYWRHCNFSIKRKLFFCSRFFSCDKYFFMDCFAKPFQYHDSWHTLRCVKRSRVFLSQLVRLFFLFVRNDP